MQITITQTEIERAIREYMSRRINIVDGTHVEIEMKATRGADGFSAIVDICENLDELNELKEAEKARVRKAKEEGLEEAGRFLNRATKATKQANEQEPEEPEEEVPAEEEQAKTSKAKPAAAKKETAEEDVELPEPKKGSIFAKSPVKA